MSYFTAINPLANIINSLLHHFKGISCFTYWLRLLRHFFNFTILLIDCFYYNRLHMTGIAEVLTYQDFYITPFVPSPS